MDGDRSDIKKFLGNSYLTNFSEDVDTLIRIFSQYVTEEIKASLINKNGGEVNTELIQNYSNTARTFIIRTYISYQTLTRNLNSSPSEESTKQKNEAIRIYNIVKTSLVINPSDIEAFLVVMNDFLYSEPIKKLLDNAQSLMAEMYGLNEHASGKDNPG